MVRRTRRTRNTLSPRTTARTLTASHNAHPKRLAFRCVRLLTTGELARELGVSRGAVLVWVRSELITPEFTTPGGHHRWDAEKVRAQLRDKRQSESD